VVTISVGLPVVVRPAESSWKPSSWMGNLLAC
jgi:hypothetical protein